VVVAGSRAGTRILVEVRDKVIDSARALGLEVDVRRLDASTATVQDAATAVGCKNSQIAKSLVFIADGDPVVCIASGAHRVDTDRLADVLDVAEVRKATPEEVRAATGFSVGGVPPFGHGLPVIFDETLLEHERVWAAGGDGHSLFEIDPQALAACTSSTVAALAV
jgi:prolyl-tRNA editing enzyme YbaK/EbsC (Cys-tRNA(Pro) deacylase)